MNSVDVETVEQLIGYVYKDKKLLVRALTHPSKESDCNKNYQTLEFLGDSIVDFIVAEQLMKQYPDSPEGTLTKLRASTVSEAPLSRAVEALGVCDFLICGTGEKRTEIWKHDSVKSDIFESLTASIYLDGGFEQAKSFVLFALKNELNNAVCTNDNVDAKSRLNEVAAKNGWTVEYVLGSESGPKHKPVFKFSVLLNGKEAGKGQGRTKHEAQQNAADSALSYVSQNL